MALYSMQILNGGGVRLFTPLWRMKVLSTFGSIKDRNEAQFTSLIPSEQKTPAAYWLVSVAGAEIIDTQF